MASFWQQTVAEVICVECGYRIRVLRTGPSSAKPEHDPEEFKRLCREGPFRFYTATGCAYLDQAYLAGARRGDF